MKKENKILTICEMVLNITEDEIKEMQEIIEGQKGYLQPLKSATTGWQRQLGEHNEKALNKLLELKHILIKGTEIKRP